MTFIDDRPKKMWVTALETKDQVLDALKEFHVRVYKEKAENS